MKKAHIYYLTSFWLTHSLAFNLPDSSTHSYECTQCSQLAHNSLRTHWVLDNKKPLIKHETLHEQGTKSYQIEVTGAELARGIKLFTEAPGAVLRIMSNTVTTPILYLKKEKEQMTLQEASSLLAKDETLHNTPFSKAKIMLQIKPELGDGEFILSSSSSLGSSDKLIIQVDDLSAQKPAFTISTDKAYYHYDDDVVVNIYARDYSNYPDSLNAYLYSPAGAQYPLVLKPLGDGLYQAKIQLSDTKNVGGENWYAEAEETYFLGTKQVQRRVHTAFSYAIPSAAVLDIKPLNENEFQYIAQIDVATASRYALQAVLFATDNKGNQIPIELAQTASWLDEGLGTMELDFSPNIKEKFTGPFYIGEIQLVDYGQIKSVFQYNTPIKLSE